MDNPTASSVTKAAEAVARQADLDNANAGLTQAEAALTRARAGESEAQAKRAIAQRDLEEAQGWVAFFERLGWEFYDCDTVSGIARRKTDIVKAGKDGRGKPVLATYTMAERIDIEHT